MSDEWVFPETDYYSDLQRTIPGVRFTTGFRTKEYQADMRRRGYKPAENSPHLTGEKLDLLPPEGKSMAWLRAEIQKHYPEGQINQNEGDHVDIRFPGYKWAPAVGNAAKAGITNPNRPDGAEWFFPEEGRAPPESETKQPPAPKAGGSVVSGVENPLGDTPTNLNDPLTRQLLGEQTPEAIQSMVEGSQAAGSTLGPTPEGDWGERVWNALQTGVLPEEYARQNPLMGGIDSLLRVMTAGTEAIRGTPLEGLATASPLGGMEVGGLSALGRIPKTPMRLSPEVEAGWKGVLETGTPEDIATYARQNNFDIREDMINDWVAGREGQKAEAVYANAPEGAPRADVGTDQVLQSPRAEGQFRTVKTYNDEELLQRLTGEKVPEAPVEVLEAAPAEGRLSVADIQGHVQEVMGSWKNAPETSIVQKADELPEEVLNDIKDQGLENDVMGFEHNGKITYIADNIDPELLSTVTYHEALGHHGLKQQFGRHLDTIVKEMYDGNKAFKAEVDAWRKDPANHGAYEEYDNPIARIAEEVLAEKANNGKIDSGTFRKLATLVKQYARKMGVKLNYSDNEIMSILSMSHDRVINGEKFSNSGDFRLLMKPAFMVRTSPIGDVTKFNDRIKELSGKPLTDDAVAELETEMARLHNLRGTSKTFDDALDKASKRLTDLEDSSNYKYMIRKSKGRALLEQKKAARAEQARKTAEAEAKRTKYAGNINMSHFRADDKVIETIREAAESLPERDVQPHLETKIKAKDLHLTEEDVVALAERGLKAEEIYGAANVSLRSGTRITKLLDRIAEGDESPQTMKEFKSEMAQFEKVMTALSDIRGDLGRGFNALNIDAKRTPASDARFMARAMEELGAGPDASPDLLRKVHKRAKELIRQSNFQEKSSTFWNEVINLPKSLMSSVDLSAPLRQGLFLIGSKAYWKAFGSMFKFAVSQKSFDGFIAEVKARDTFPNMKRGGLALTDITGSLTHREEAFMSHIQNKIPVLKHVFLGGERAYLGFLNKLRADAFDSLYRDYKRAGITVTREHEKAISKFINTATGRGSLGSLDHAAVTLNKAFFSPRLIASRVQLLRPKFYKDLPPIVRGKALKSLLSFGGIAGTVLGLASLSGLEVGTDPTDTDYGKIKVGNTRYDIFGGFQQYVVLGARLIEWAKEHKDTMTGEGPDPKFGETTGKDRFINFFLNKLAPVPAFFTSFFRGKNTIGDKFNGEEEAKKLVIPLFLQDLWKLYEDGGMEAVPMGIPAAFGVGISTYERKSKKTEEEPVEDEWSFPADQLQPAN